MTDLHLPPPPQEPPPKWLQFPRDMEVNGDMTPASWFVNHTTGNVWLWIRQPLVTFVQNFGPEAALTLSTQLAEHAGAAAELAMNTKKLVEVRAPILGPDGRPV